MNFVDLFFHFLSRVEGEHAHKPPHHQPTRRRTAVNIPKDIVLEISKAIEQLAFVDRSYSLGIWPTDQSKADWKHDLGVMRLFGDLKELRLELLAADKTVLFEQKIQFNGTPAHSRAADIAKGVEVPVLPPIVRDAVSDHRVIVAPCRKDLQYRDLLRINWSPAATLKKREGDAYRSSHCEAITGGREIGSFHVTTEGQHRVVVHRCGPHGYAFAKAPEMQNADVYLNIEHAPAGFRFRVGQQLRCLIVQTPRGLQARSIRAA